MFSPRLFVLIFLVARAAGLAAAPSAAIELHVDPALGIPLAESGVTGVFVAFDSQSETWITNDTARARTGYLPASTFKVPNSLIALEVGAVDNVDVVLKWDGKDRSSSGWNADQSMRQAIERSTVWFYQELARRAGETRMREWVQRIGYGNADIGGGIDQFWLSGALRITPVQQIEFLRRLQSGDLPFRPAIMADVREIMIRERRANFVIRAKTGWARAASPEVGWFVGWVERDGKAWFFATELDLRTSTDAPKRLAVAYANLVRIGALPAGTAPPK